jgi:DNA-binding response OmpR family regulator
MQDTVQPQPQKTKVLVIEDDSLTRISLCRIFQKMGYATSEACNGLMGIKMFNQEHPHIVVTDLLMPDKEGLETITEIRAADNDVKIIAMSGGGSAQNFVFLDLALKIGANYTLSKPFKPVEILDLMNKLSPRGA